MQVFISILEHGLLQVFYNVIQCVGFELDWIFLEQNTCLLSGGTLVSIKYTYRDISPVCADVNVVSVSSRERPYREFVGLVRKDSD